MITSVKIQNYKSLKNVETDLERLTVFVGANGSGKTSVLSAIHFAVLTSESRSKALFNDNELHHIYSRGGDGPMLIDCTTTTSRVQFSISMTTGGKPEFTAIAPCNGGPANLLKGKRCVFVHFSSHELAKPSYSDKSPPELSEDGSGLASVLAHLALSAPKDFERLLEAFKSIIPSVQQIRFAKVPIQRQEIELIKFENEVVERKNTRTFQGEALLFDFDNASDVQVSHVSEGTLLVLGILTVVMGVNRPDVLLLDDIEHGLHPLAQKQLILLLRNLIAQFPNLQIIATAHSPYLLDELRPEEIRLMAAGEDGYSVCGKLSDHPLFEQWKDEMAPGELWSMFGEKWLVDQGAAK